MLAGTLAAVGVVAVGAILLGSGESSGQASPSDHVAGVDNGQTVEPAATASSNGPFESVQPSPSDPGTLAGPTAATPVRPDTGPMQLTDRTLHTWVDQFGEVRAQILATAWNGGDTPVWMPGARSTWRIRDRAGQIVASGRFAHAFPEVVAPGEHVLFIETLSATLAERSELSDLEIETDARPIDESAKPIVLLTVTDLTWGQAEDGGLLVRGRVSNETGLTVADVRVGVVLRDRAGSALGGLYDASIGTMTAGSVREFVSDYPGTPPVEPADVATAEAVAAGTR